MHDDDTDDIGAIPSLTDSKKPLAVSQQQLQRRTVGSWKTSPTDDMAGSLLNHTQLTGDVSESFAELTTSLWNAPPSFEKTSTDHHSALVESPKWGEGFQPGIDLASPKGNQSVDDTMNRMRRILSTSSRSAGGDVCATTTNTLQNAAPRPDHPPVAELLPYRGNIDDSSTPRLVEFPNEEHPCDAPNNAPWTSLLHAQPASLTTPSANVEDADDTLSPLGTQLHIAVPRFFPSHSSHSIDSHFSDSSVDDPPLALQPRWYDSCDGESTATASSTAIGWASGSELSLSPRGWSTGSLTEAGGLVAHVAASAGAEGPPTDSRSHTSAVYRRRRRRIPHASTIFSPVPESYNPVDSA